MTTAQETPNYDPIGAARDAAFAALPGIQERLNRDIPQKGQFVVVFAGRSAGAFGRVFWIGRKREFGRGLYRERSWALVDHLVTVYQIRIGIETSDGSIAFVDADKVQVVRG